jgi:hypothetical protein
MARVTQRELLIEAMKALYGLAGIGTGRVTELFKDGAGNEQLLDCIQLAEKEARAQWMKRHEQHHKTLGVLLEEAGLNERGASLDYRMSLVPKAKEKFKARSDKLIELGCELRRIGDRVWLAASAQCQHDEREELAGARTEALWEARDAIRAARQKLDDVTFDLGEED